MYDIIHASLMWAKAMPNWNFVKRQLKFDKPLIKHMVQNKIFFHVKYAHVLY